LLTAEVFRKEVAFCREAWLIPERGPAYCCISLLLIYALFNFCDLVCAFGAFRHCQRRKQPLGKQKLLQPVPVLSSLAWVQREAIASEDKVRESHLFAKQAGRLSSSIRHSWNDPLLSPVAATANEFSVQLHWVPKTLRAPA
jgi:hypothetical protein